MALHDSFGNSEANSGAFIFIPAVQTLEHLEDASGAFHFHANAVVLYREVPPAAAGLSANRDLRCPVRVELDCIVDQVLEYLAELNFVGHHSGQLVEDNFGLIAFNRRMQSMKDVRENRRGMGGLWR